MVRVPADRSLYLSRYFPVQVRDAGWFSLPALPWKTPLQTDQNEGFGISVTGSFKPADHLDNCARIAVGLWDSSNGSKVQLFMLSQALRGALMHVDAEWRQISCSLSSLSRKLEDAQDISESEGC